MKRGNTRSSRTHASGWVSTIFGAAVAIAAYNAIGGPERDVPVFGLQNTQTLQASETAAAVFTGEMERTRAGVELYMSGKVDHLFISGLPINITPKKLLERMKVPATRDPAGITIDRVSQNTEQNAEATARWVRLTGARNLVLVTNDYHMPRSILNLQRYLGSDITLYQSPVAGSIGTAGYMAELAKTALTRVGISGTTAQNKSF